MNSNDIHDKNGADQRRIGFVFNNFQGEHNGIFHDDAGQIPTQDYGPDCSY